MQKEIDPRELKALEDAYLSLLCMPIGGTRFKCQKLLAGCRDALAELTGRSSEEIQNDYEERAMKIRFPQS